MGMLGGKDAQVFGAVVNDSVILYLSQKYLEVNYRF